MDMKFHFGLAGFLFMVCFVYKGSSLLCYQCTTKNPDQEDCLNITAGDTRYLHNCTAPTDQSCRIQVQWIDFDILDWTRDRHVIRACASTPYDPNGACFYRTGNLGRMSICNCAGDRCNRAPATFDATFMCATLLLFWVAMFFAS
ncbi:hypothetical protein JTE90_028289 [Oedothorax gibbosus]|uniref:Protein sleepless n=1 Tax=Oedothorax gibbosus TaxID=931172 RepID=A0AAV6UDM4_9ARAC|nr:hypothetical protein JTE90_028289 [Oedothorax gibbosus]